MESYNTKCERCGKQVVKSRNGRVPRFCSHECRTRKVLPGQVIVCERCGDAIEYGGVGRRPKFCGNRCAVLAGQAAYQERIRTGAYGECTVDGCSSVAVGRHGMCQIHRDRIKRNGDTDLRKRGNDRKVGTRRVAKSGYVIVTVGESSGYKRAQQLEHRVVMEQQLGRPLAEGENVHHINGRRDDNRPENLELWVKPQPAGQRPEDLVDWVCEHYPDLVAKRMTK